jgi:hypothetical protein
MAGSSRIQWGRPREEQPPPLPQQQVPLLRDEGGGGCVAGATANNREEDRQQERGQQQQQQEERQEVGGTVKVGGNKEQQWVVPSAALGMKPTATASACAGDTDAEVLTRTAAIAPAARQEVSGSQAKHCNNSTSVNGAYGSAAAAAAHIRLSLSLSGGSSAGDVVLEALRSGSWEPSQGCKCSGEDHACTCCRSGSRLNNSNNSSSSSNSDEELQGISVGGGRVEGEGYPMVVGGGVGATAISPSAAAVAGKAVVEGAVQEQGATCMSRVDEEKLALQEEVVGPAESPPPAAAVAIAAGGVDVAGRAAVVVGHGARPAGVGSAAGGCGRRSVSRLSRLAVMVHADPAVEDTEGQQQQQQQQQQKQPQQQQQEQQQQEQQQQEEGLQGNAVRHKAGEVAATSAEAAAATDVETTDVTEKVVAGFTTADLYLAGETTEKAAAAAAAVAVPAAAVVEGGAVSVVTSPCSTPLVAVAAGYVSYFSSPVYAEAGSCSSTVASSSSRGGLKQVQSTGGASSCGSGSFAAPEGESPRAPVMNKMLNGVYTVVSGSGRRKGANYVPAYMTRCVGARERK